MQDEEYDLHLVYWILKLHKDYLLDDLSRFMAILLRPFGFTCSQRLLNYLAIQYFDYEGIRWRWSQKNRRAQSTQTTLYHGICEVFSTKPLSKLWTYSRASAQFSDFLPHRIDCYGISISQMAMNHFLSTYISFFPLITDKTFTWLFFFIRHFANSVI
jgi:hypothetical protein